MPRRDRSGKLSGFQLSAFKISVFPSLHPSRQASAADSLVSDRDGSVDTRQALPYNASMPTDPNPIGHNVAANIRLTAVKSENHQSRRYIMKNLIGIYLILVASGVGCSQKHTSTEMMTPEQFKKLVATPGDAKPLRPELASLPFWTNATCHITLNFQDGRVFDEEMAQTAKTIGGNYVVFSMDSRYYKQPMHSILAYDEKALAIKQWGLFGDGVTEETMLFDLKKKISSSTSTYAGGFMEISVGSFSEMEASGRAQAFKNGVLYLTREVRTWPGTLKPGDATNGNVPVPTGTTQTPTASGFRR